MAHIQIKYPSREFSNIVSGIEKLDHLHCGYILAIVVTDFFDKTGIEILAPPTTAVEQHHTGGWT